MDGEFNMDQVKLIEALEADVQMHMRVAVKAIDAKVMLAATVEGQAKRIAELEALINAGRKQEPVAWRHLYKGNEVVYYPYINRGSFYTEITPLYTAPVVAPDVLKELLWIRTFFAKDPETGGVVIKDAQGKEISKWIDRVDAFGGAV